MALAVFVTIIFGTVLLALGAMVASRPFVQD